MTGRARRRVLANARFTLDGGRVSDAAAVGDDDRFVGFGTLAEARQLAGRDAEEIDLGGGVALPGFHDSHVHLLNLGRSRLGASCWPDEVDSIDGMAGVVRRVAATLPAGQWVRGRGFNPTRLRERRSPTASELDLPDGRPVMIDSFDFHRRVLNAAGLRLAGITRDTPDPRDGEIVRDERGEPTGELLDSARSLADAVATPWSAQDDARAVTTAASRFLAAGFTSVTNAAPITMSTYGEELRALALADGRDELPLRVTTMLRAEALDAAATVGLVTGFGSERLRVNGFKVFADGAFGPRTACVCEEYVGGGHGRPAVELEELVDYRQRAEAIGWRLCVHAIGDAAVARVADALAGGAPGHRVEHCTLADTASVAALASVGAIPVPQIGFLRERSSDFAEVLGADRMARLIPLRTWIEHGLRPVHSSDAPVVHDIAPAKALHAMVTRADAAGQVWGVDEAITVDQALATMTVWAAAADGAGHRRGRLVSGADADITVLDGDPRAVPAEELGRLGVLATVVAGAAAWRAG